MDQLVKEGILSKTGKDTYIRKKDKTPESEFTFVKDEADGQIAPQDGKPIAPEDYLYMKALYHSLLMQYVTITKLHNMLDGEANQTAVRNLMDRMTQEGYVEASSNRRLGKRVIHSSLTERKLNEVKKVELRSASLYPFSLWLLITKYIWSYDEDVTVLEYWRKREAVQV